MKNILFTISLLSCLPSIGQDRIFSTEGFTTFQQNPASFGNQEKWSLNVLGQAQWTDFYGVPGALSIYGGGRIPLESAGHHEFIIGGSFRYNHSYFDDDQGGHLALGYRFNFNENTSLTVSVAPGLYDIQYNLFVPIYLPGAIGDDTVFTAINHDTQFDLSSGLMFSWKTLYAGVSVSHLNSPQVGLNSAILPANIGFQAGYKIPLNEDYIFPMVQWHYMNGFRTAQIMTHYVYKNDLFSIGIGYQTGGNLILGASSQLNGFRLGYNYNLSGSTSEDNKGGIHEMRLSYSIKTKKR
jgi:type IX secretion system PorP/SprF family membrane protein